ncbi:MAG: hypothetical protein SGI84_07410 [Gemmatimonadota bacterium]|nr:hypothetical protein [Gemmatimonadota bacterium]
MAAMKMLVIIYSGAEPARVRSILDAHPIGGYTEFDPVHGVGTSGRREGSRAWPGLSRLFMSVMSAECARAVGAAMRTEAGNLPPGERLHVGVLAMEEFG